MVNEWLFYQGINNSHVTPQIYTHGLAITVEYFSTFILWFEYSRLYQRRQIYGTEQLIQEKVTNFEVSIRP